MDSNRRQSKISLYKRPKRKLQSHWHDFTGSKRVAKGEPGFGDYSTLDEKADKFFYYRIRDDILSGWNIYLIKLKDNIVFETETGVEDW